MEQLDYTYYYNEQLQIDSIDSRLLNEEKMIRRYIMNYIIDNGEGLNINNISKISNDMQVQEEDIKHILDSLLKKSSMVTDDKGNINFIYPVSAIPTNHKVKLADGRIFNAMCAIDAMGAAFTFNQDVNIESNCSKCGENVSLSIKDGKLYTYKPSDLHILHVDLNKNCNWSGDC